MTARSLRFLGHELVHLVQGSFCWVEIKRFAIDGDGSDTELLAALIADQQYKDHYAGQDPVAQAQGDLHGPTGLAQ